MISAIAARKAAQAELKKVPDTPHVEEQVAPTLGGTPRLNSKRKAPSQDAKPSKRKRVKKEKGKHAELPKERYFTKQKDDFKEQEDIIVMGLDDDDEDVDELSQDSDLEPGPSLVPSKVRRKWSPSRMVEDFSEEDSAEVSAGPELDLSPFFPRSARKPVVFDENRILSTFQPTTDQNTFVLTAEEVSALDSSSQNVGGTILILTPADSLCILGACLLTVIHGSISLCGSTLHSSSTAHRIYAPRSSPLPIIRHAAGGGSIANSVQLPHRLVEFPRNSAIILLRELLTGVEGLGQICRSFEGVFEPSKWQKGKAEAPFDIPGLYMVSCSFFQLALHPFSMHSVGHSPDERHTALHDVTIMGTGVGGCFFISGVPFSGNIPRQRPKELRKEHLLSNTLKSAFDSVNAFAFLLTTANAFFFQI